MPEKKLVEALTSGSIIGVLGTLIAALKSKDPIIERLKNMGGGLLAVIAVSFWLRNSTWSPITKEALIGFTGAFIGIYWPEVQALIKWLFVLIRLIIRKLVGKKLDIEIPENLNENKNDDVQNTSNI